MTGYRLEEVDQSRFLQDNSGAVLLGSNSWVETLEKLFPGSVLYLSFYKGDELQASLFLQHRSRFGIRQLYTPLLTPWTVINWHHERTGHSQRRLHQHLTAELAQFVRQRFHTAALKFSPADSDIRSFQWDGWESRWRYSYQLTDSREPSAFLKKKLKRSADLQVRVEQPTPELLQLLTTALREDNFTSLPVELLSHLIEELVTRQLARLLVVRSGEQMMAFQVMLEQEGWRGLWMQLTLPEFRAATPGTHLVQHILDSNNGHTLDFLGADDPAIDEHKSAFEGDLISYPEVLWFSNPLLRRIYHRRNRTARIK